MSIFTVFLKNRNFIAKIRISKVTDYAALTMTTCTYPEDEPDSVGISVVVSISGSVVESLSIKETKSATMNIFRKFFISFLNHL